MSLIPIFITLMILILFLNLMKLNRIIYFLFFCIVILNININIFYLDNKNYYVNLIFLYLLAMFIAKKIRFTKFHYPSDKTLLLIQGSIAIQIFLLTLQFFSGIRASINEIFMLASISLLVLIFSKESKLQKDLFLKFFSFVILFNSLLGFVQWITKKPLLLNNESASLIYTEGLQDVIRVIGIVGSNNGAGNLGAIFFPITVYMYLKNKNVYYLLLVLFNLMFLILTLTRIGILAVIIVAIIMILLFKAKSLMGFTLKYLLVFCLISVSLIVWINFGDGIVNLLFDQRGNTAGSRFIQYDNILTILKGESIKEIILGIGSGEYIPYLQSYYGTWDIVIHSIFLNKLIEEGIISLIAYLFMVVMLTFYATKKIDAKYKWIPALVSICYLITSNFNPAQYYFLPNIMYYTFMIGISLLESNERKEAENEKKPTIYKRKWYC